MAAPVNADHRLFPLLSVVVDGVGENLLACARFACQQNGEHGLGGFIACLFDLCKAWAVADDFIEGILRAVSAAVFLSVKFIFGIFPASASLQNPEFAVGILPVPRLQ